MKSIVSSLNLTLYTQNLSLDRSIKGCYSGDLLSDVLARACIGCLWITIQMHPNIIPVAVMKEFPGILIVNGRIPEPEVISKAENERVVLLGTPLSAYEISGRLWELGFQP
ncbi:MAG TPA: serine kinase [Thermoanaerobaculia bacterium]|nr:serine kinase [Thermoanaerobaculia bacterium]HUM28642.1 serine kinase [Thermoanaerobaculia bacterium]HXK66750.1 serine kinase [Thermoanaerobaculia bacterium]